MLLGLAVSMATVSRGQRIVACESEWGEESTGASGTVGDEPRWSGGFHRERGDSSILTKMAISFSSEPQT